MEDQLLKEGWEKESVVKEGTTEITTWLRDRKLEELRKIIHKSSHYISKERVEELKKE